MFDLSRPSHSRRPGSPRPTVAPPVRSDSTAFAPAALPGCLSAASPDSAATGFGSDQGRGAQHDFAHIPVDAPPAPGAERESIYVSRPGDEYEREGNRAADRAMSGLGLSSTPQHATGATPKVDIARVVESAVATPGRPLVGTVRPLMESRFGHDFGRVRIHAGTAAADAAQAMQARAFTVGEHIVLGAGKGDEATRPSLPLLAHELAHVVQARPLGPSGPVLRQPEGEAGATDENLVDGLSKLLKRGKYPAPDDLILLVAALRERKSIGDTFVLEHSSELFQLLAPWGFSGEFVSPRGDPQAAKRSFRAMVESLDRALDAWRAEDPKKRDERRRRTSGYGGTYASLPTREQMTAREGQVESEEIPGSGPYEGRRKDVRAEREAARNRAALGQIENIRASGPVSLLNRAWGALLAGATGGDTQAGGEMGAAVGGLGDLAFQIQGLREMRGDRESIERRTDRPVAAEIQKREPGVEFADTQVGSPERKGSETQGTNPPPGGGNGGAGGGGRARRETLVRNPPPMPRKPPPPRPVIEWFPRRDATPVSPEDVLRVLDIDHTRVIWSFDRGNNMTEWSIRGGEGLPPLAFTADGYVRVDHERWREMGYPEHR